MTVNDDAEPARQNHPCDLRNGRQELRYSEIFKGLCVFVCLYLISLRFSEPCRLKLAVHSGDFTKSGQRKRPA